MFVVVSASILCFLVALADLSRRKVGNTLVIAGIALGVIYVLAPLSHPPAFPANGLTSLGGGVLGLVLFLPFWLRGVMGAGDVKFLAVLGIWFGPLGVAACWLLASLMALVHAVRRRGLMPLRVQDKSNEGRKAPVDTSGSRSRAPYAAFLAAGAIAWMLFFGADSIGSIPLMSAAMMTISWVSA